MTRSGFWVAALAATVLAAGCGDDDDADTPAGTTQAAEPATPASFPIEVTTSGKEAAISFPKSVKSGLVTMTLTNNDSKPRSAAIVRIVGARTVDDVLKVVDAEDEVSKIPTWIEDGGGVGVVAPGKSATVTQVLAPGKYAIWEDEGEDAGDAKGEFTVTGPASDAELPEQPATVTATDDGEDSYGFEFDGLKAGSNEVRFENTGEELHHALFFPILGDNTIEDVEKFAQTEGESGGPPPVDFEKGVSTPVIDGGIAQNMTLELKAGRYAVICFLSDRAGGKPHVADGMIEELEIS